MVHRYAVLSCLRVVLEVASIGFWLIQPGIGPRKRLERTLTFARYSVTQRSRAERLQSNRDDLSNLGKMRETIGRVAAENGLRRLTGERERRIPDAAQLIGDHFDCLGRSRRDAISVYGLLSEFTHGNFLGSMLGYRKHTTDDTILRPRVPLGEIALAANYASVGLSSTIEAFVSYMGWDAEAWQDKAQPHLSTIEAVAHVLRDIS